MAEIRFYHLTTKSLDQALPEILSKAYEQGRKVVVKAPGQDLLKHLNDTLWTWRADSFLPHGTEKEGKAADQPIWLTTKDENPNGAEILVLAGGATSPAVGNFTLCCEMLDGHDQEMVAAARTRWKEYKEAGHDITYWQQEANGRWTEKA